MKKALRNIRKASLVLLTAVAVVIACGCTKTDDPNNGGNGSGNNGGGGTNPFNGHEYVDLGLPSGTLWATCNVGADAPEGYGDFFSWGETQPKTTYNTWSNYKYCNVQNEPLGECQQLTKYCDDENYGFNGFTDNLNTLLPVDDAASYNWGGGWRTPTANEWIELYENVPSIMTNQNGISGRLFTASNGQSLFLPAANCYTTEFNFAGRYGLYWSSTLRPNYPTAASDFDFSYSRYGMNYYICLRCGGLPIRPVCSAE